MDVVDAGLAEQLQLVLSEIGLGLVEEAEIVTPVAQGRQDVAEISHVDDVVDGLEVEPAVALHESLDFLEDARRTLAAKGHARTVEPAERAVRLGAPPAAARGLERQPRLGEDLGGEARLGEPLEVFAVVGNGEAVHRELVSHRLIDHDGLAHLPEAETRMRMRRSPGQEIPHHLDHDRLALAAHDNVDPRKGAQEGSAHGSIAIGTPEDDGQRRVGLLQLAGEGQRRHGLAEGRGETHHARKGSRQIVDARVQERRDEFPHPSCLVYVALRHPMTAHVVQICRVSLARFREGRPGKDPLPEADPVVLDGHRLVVCEADPQVLRLLASGHAAVLHEIERVRANLGPDPRVLEERPEGAQLYRRQVEHMPRHGHEHDTPRAPRSTGRAAPRTPTSPHQRPRLMRAEAAERSITMPRRALVLITIARVDGRSREGRARTSSFVMLSRFLARVLPFATALRFAFRVFALLAMSPGLLRVSSSEGVWSDDFPVKALAKPPALLLVAGLEALQELLDVGARGGWGVQEHNTARLAARALPSVRDVAREERAGTGSAHGNLLADHEGDLAREHPGDLIAVAVEMEEALGARGHGLLEQHDALVRLAAEELQRREAAWRRHVQMPSPARGYDKALRCLHVRLLRSHARATGHVSLNGPNGSASPSRQRSGTTPNASIRRCQPWKNIATMPRSSSSSSVRSRRRSS